MKKIKKESIKLILYFLIVPIVIFGGMNVAKASFTAVYRDCGNIQRTNEKSPTTISIFSGSSWELTCTSGNVVAEIKPKLNAQNNHILSNKELGNFAFKCVNTGYGSFTEHNISVEKCPARVDKNAWQVRTKEIIADDNYYPILSVSTGCLIGRDLDYMLPVNSTSSKDGITITSNGTTCSIKAKTTAFNEETKVYVKTQYEKYLYIITTVKPTSTDQDDDTSENDNQETTVTYDDYSQEGPTETETEIDRNNNESRDDGEWPLIWVNQCKTDSTTYNGVATSNYVTTINGKTYPAFCIEPEKSAPSNTSYTQRNFSSTSDAIDKSYVAVIQKAIEVYGDAFTNLNGNNAGDRDIYQVLTIALRKKAVAAGFIGNVPGTESYCYKNNEIGPANSSYTNDSDLIARGQKSFDNLQKLLNAPLWEPKVTLEFVKQENINDENLITLKLNSNIGIIEDSDSKINGAGIFEISLEGTNGFTFTLQGDKNEFQDGNELVFKVEGEGFQELCQNGEFKVNAKINYKDPRDIKYISKETVNNQEYQTMISVAVEGFADDKDGTTMSIDNLSITCANCTELVESLKESENKTIGEDLLVCCDEIPALIEEGFTFAEGLEEKYNETCAEAKICTNVETGEEIDLTSCIDEKMKADETITEEDALATCTEENCPTTCDELPSDDADPDGVEAWKTECCETITEEDNPEGYQLCHMCDIQPEEGTDNTEWIAQCCPEDIAEDDPNYEYCQKEDPCLTQPTEENKEEWTATCCPEDMSEDDPNYEICNPTVDPCLTQPTEGTDEEVSSWKSQCCNDLEESDPNYSFCKSNACIQSKATVCSIGDASGSSLTSEDVFGYIYEGTNENLEEDFQNCILHSQDPNEVDYSADLPKSDYCTTACKENIEYYFPGYGYDTENETFNIKSGSAFDLRKYSGSDGEYNTPRFDSKRTCVQDFNAEKFDSDIKKANKEAETALNNLKKNQTNYKNKCSTDNGEIASFNVNTCNNSCRSELQACNATNSTTCNSSYNKCTALCTTCSNYVNNAGIAKDTYNTALTTIGSVKEEYAKCKGTTKEDSSWSSVYDTKPIISFEYDEMKNSKTDVESIMNEFKNNGALQENVLIDGTSETTSYCSDNNFQNCNASTKTTEYNLYLTKIDSIGTDAGNITTSKEEFNTTQYTRKDTEQSIEYTIKYDLISDSSGEVLFQGESSGTSEYNSLTNETGYENYGAYSAIGYRLPTSFYTRAGKYSYSMLIQNIGNNGRLNKFFNEVNNTMSSDTLNDKESIYICQYVVGNYIICNNKTEECPQQPECYLGQDGQGNDIYDQDCLDKLSTPTDDTNNIQESSNNFYTKTVSLDNLFPQERTIGSNWTNKKAIALESEMATNANKTYEEPLVEFILDRNKMLEIKEYNDMTNYADFIGTCSDDGNGLECYSKFLSDLFASDEITNLEAAREKYKYYDYNTGKWIEGSVRNGTFNYEGIGNKDES